MDGPRGLAQVLDCRRLRYRIQTAKREPPPDHLMPETGAGVQTAGRVTVVGLVIGFVMGDPP